MRFDFTHDQNAKYMVSIYRRSVSDYCYYSNFKDAKAFFNQMKDRSHEKGTILSLYDMTKDKRKEFVKF